MTDYNSIMSAIQTEVHKAYKEGREEGYKNGINEVEAYHVGFDEGYKRAIIDMTNGNLKPQQIEKTCATCSLDNTPICKLHCQDKSHWECDKIEFGDEVQSDYTGDCYMVISPTYEGNDSILVCMKAICLQKDHVHKTDRSFPEIAEYLNQLNQKRSK